MVVPCHHHLQRGQTGALDSEQKDPEESSLKHSHRFTLRLDEMREFHARQPQRKKWEVDRFSTDLEYQRGDHGRYCRHNSLKPGD